MVFVWRAVDATAVGDVSAVVRLICKLNETGAEMKVSAPVFVFFDSFNELSYLRLARMMKPSDWEKAEA